MTAMSIQRICTLKEHPGAFKYLGLQGGMDSKGSFSEQVIPESDKKGLLVVIRWRKGSRASRQGWAGKGAMHGRGKAVWNDCPGFTGTWTAQETKQYA